MMRRRHLVKLLGCATTWPYIGHGKQPAMLGIGFLSGASPGPFAGLVAAFRQCLNDTGFVEDQNVAID